MYLTGVDVSSLYVLYCKLVVQQIIITQVCSSTKTLLNSDAMLVHFFVCMSSVAISCIILTVLTAPIFTFKYISYLPTSKRHL